MFSSKVKVFKVPPLKVPILLEDKSKADKNYLLEFVKLKWKIINMLKDRQKPLTP